MSDDDAREAPLYWGPGGPPAKPELVDSWTPGRSDDSSWGPYHQVLFRPREVTPWVRFKTMTTGVNMARRLWDEREHRRVEYEAAHGDDPEKWPVRHSGVVLESVQWIAHAACLGCQWLDPRGTSMRVEGWRATAADAAREHHESVE